MPQSRFSRRTVLGAAAAMTATATLSQRLAAQEASPSTGE